MLTRGGANYDLFKSVVFYDFLQENTFCELEQNDWLGNILTKGCASFYDKSKKGSTRAMYLSDLFNIEGSAKH